MNMRIGLLCTHLFRTYSGGTVTLCLDLAEAMSRRGYLLSIFTDRRDGHEKSRRLPPGIRTHECAFSGKHGDMAFIKKQMREDGLHVAVSIQSYREHLLWAVALMDSGIPFLYSEHNDPAWIEARWSRTGRLAAMSGADSIHLLLPEYAASLPPFLRKRVTHIFNPAPPVSPGASPARPEEPPLIVCSLGRIAPVKELPLLMRAFARLSTRFPMWELHIWGKDGVEMDLAAQWRLSPARDRIRLRGLTPDPLAAFRRAHVFCIPSRCEGMPLTILEAMSCGLPVVGFADCAGVRALIRDGENGLLAAAREEEALAETLARLMESAALRERLGRGGLETAAAYAPEAVWDQWEALLRRTAACKGRTRMDAFAQDPFASQARLSTAARQEWVLREFGQPLPGSLAWHTKRLRDVWHGLLCGTLPTKRGDYGCFD